MSLLNCVALSGPPVLVMGDVQNHNTTLYHKLVLLHEKFVSFLVHSLLVLVSNVCVAKLSCMQSLFKLEQLGTKFELVDYRPSVLNQSPYARSLGNEPMNKASGIHTQPRVNR